MIVEKNYLSSPDDVVLLPNAAAGLRSFRELGYGLVLITNQSGVGRGYFDQNAVDRVHQRLAELLEPEGVEFDGIYICPHAPDAQCACRKPSTALVERAAVELGFQASRTVVVGDKQCDVELGRSVEALTVLVKTGYGIRELAGGMVKPDLVADDLLDAAALIAKRAERSARLRRHFGESIATKQRVLAECEGQILAAAGVIAGSLDRGGKLLLCGNGGSAADCQHIAAEFVSVLTQDYLRPGLPAIALTTDSSILTASANDFGFDGIFERQVQALARPGDVLIGISTSGNSANVRRAIEYANGHGVDTIAMTGGSGGKIGGVAQTEIRVPSEVTMHIQEAHITIGHILCDFVERALGTAE